MEPLSHASPSTLMKRGESETLKQRAAVAGNAIEERTLLALSHLVATKLAVEDRCSFTTDASPLGYSASSPSRVVVVVVTPSSGVAHRYYCLPLARLCFAVLGLPLLRVDLLLFLYHYGELQKQTKPSSTPLSGGGGGLLVSTISSVGQLPSVPVHDVTVGSYILVGAGEGFELQQIVDIGKTLPLFIELQTLGTRDSKAQIF
ncbi:uncharacterized protein DS421_18g620800 [Arachis hypogaea]|nr:uncharacterized protein DS421_18g620800 [Arachis hypogaea]